MTGGKGHNVSWGDTKYSTQRNQALRTLLAQGVHTQRLFVSGPRSSEGHVITSQPARGCPSHKHASLGPAFEGKLGSFTPSLAKLPAEKLEIILEGWTAIQNRRWTPGLERAKRGLLSPRPEKLTSGKLEPDCYVIYDFVFGFVFFFLFLLNHWQLLSEDLGCFFFFFSLQLFIVLHPSENKRSEISQSRRLFLTVIF